MVHCSHEVTTEHASNGTAGVEYARSLREFILTVPRADNVLHARVES